MRDAPGVSPALERGSPPPPPSLAPSALALQLIRSSARYLADSVQDRLLPYGVALLASAAALAMSLWVVPRRSVMVSLCFLIAIAVTGWFWGAGPSLLATILSAFAVDYFFLNPQHHIGFSTSDDALTLGVFAVIALFVSAVNERLRAGNVRADFRMARALAMSESRYRSLVEATAQVVWTANAQGEIRPDADSWEVLTGQRSTESQGAGAWAMVAPEDREATLREWRRAFGAREMMQAEVKLASRAGGYRHVLMRGVPVLDQQGNVVEWVGTITVIDDAKRATEERARALHREQALRAEAEEANRAKSEFLAAMSHELRTPLNAIGGFAQLIALGVHGPVTEGQQQALERITRNHQHLLGVINDILNFSRLEAGQLRYQIESVPVHELLDELGGMMEPQTRAKRIEYVYSPCDADSVVARGDREKMLQIAINLVSNAIKFTEPGGRVEVACGRHGETVYIEVRDTGCGIPPSKLDAIFEPFVQLDRAHARSVEGTGLGLAISRDLARGMHGELSVRSQVGDGSVFTLIMPAEHDA